MGEIDSLKERRGHKVGGQVMRRSLEMVSVRGASEEGVGLWGVYMSAGCRGYGVPGAAGSQRSGWR